jgi:hypothetical protein
VPIEHLAEQALAEFDALFLAHVRQARCLPDGFRRLDDEGRSRLVETIGMGLEPAALGLLEIEGEGVEQLAGAEPDEAAIAQVDVRLIGGGVLVADAAVQPVGRDDQIRINVGIVLDIGFVDQIHTQLRTTGLQDVQELLAADAAEAVAAGAHRAAVDVNVDIVPMVEGFEDLVGRLRIGFAQRSERLVGKDHTPAKGIAGAVALQYRDLVRGVLLLHQKREIQAGRAAAYAGDAHAWELLQCDEL